jgi:hypothetical protein
MGYDPSAIAVNSIKQRGVDVTASHCDRCTSFTKSNGAPTKRFPHPADVSVVWALRVAVAAPLFAVGDIMTITDPIALPDHIPATS